MNRVIDTKARGVPADQDALEISLAELRSNPKRASDLSLGRMVQVKHEGRLVMTLSTLTELRERAWE